MNSEGIGMGLMICKSLVNINGGEINVYSEGENKGTVFSFTMRMDQVDMQCSEESKMSNLAANMIEGSSDPITL